jgi:hypothetical protein
VKPTLSVIAAITLTAAAAQAQAPPPPPPPETQQAPPPLSTSSAPAPPVAPGHPPGVAQVTREKLQRIYHIRQLEGVLTNAVKAGASTLASQMQMSEPSLFVVTNARTRGFELEDFGVFFDVDVPPMLQSAAWSVQVRQEYVDSLRQTIADVRVDPTMRRIAEIELRKLDRRLGLVQSQQAPPAQFPAQGGVVVAQTTDAPAVAPASASAVAPLTDLRDPNERYTDAIKDKLIDAMLTYGGVLGLDDREWLVIAARATSDAMPGGLDDSASILIRIKGEDLNAYVQKKITRDEVVKKIEIKLG